MRSNTGVSQLQYNRKYSIKLIYKQDKGGNMKNFTLGLDLGTNSIGWAIVENDKDKNPKGIINTGCRIFQEAVDAKTRVPKNQSRRQARAARRLVSRRKMRRNKLLNLLISKSFLPDDQVERERLFSDTAFEPYGLRKSALDKKLTPYEFGRVMYNLCQRRGFQSNRKTDSKDKDSSKISEYISSLREAMKNSKSRSLGEYLANQPKKRGHYTDRTMYQEEFELIWQKQQQYYPELLSPAYKVAAHNTIFFQRPLKQQKNLIGKCTFEPSRKRAPRALLEYQGFRMLSDVNNLTIKDPITRDYRALREDERKKLFLLLEKQKTLGWGKARTALGLHKSETFNLEDGKKKELIGNKTAWTLRAILKKQWDERPIEKQNSLITDMLTIDNPAGFLNRMKSYWNFDDETAERLAKTELEPGYGRLSLKAINKILPFLEQGMIYDKACLVAGYNHSSPNKQTTVDKLGEPPHLRNPVVQKALYETRKLINAIIRQYGKPSIIRIEMARDMKLSKEQRLNVLKIQNEQKKTNDRAREILQTEFGIQNPTREDVQKYNLWQECKMVCPYTNDTISRQSLFSQSVDVEHIIPYSRSLDDSYMNKTLCMASENRAVKKNKTPYEAYHANEDKYQKMLQRVKDLPFRKRRKFEQKEVNTEEFVERQLNDTRYICREVKNYLQQLGVAVEISKGVATWALRHQWNLNKVIAENESTEKNRNDHRHHAVDAIIVALTSRSLFRKISYISNQNGRGLSDKGFRLDDPWPSFYLSVFDKVQNIIVSHASSRRISGALHEETAYGYSEHDNCFVYRKPLNTLTLNEVEKIRDKKIQELLRARLAEYENDIKKAFGDETNPLMHIDGKTPVKTVRLALNLNLSTVHGIKNQDGSLYKYFRYGNNHHVEIIENVKTGKRKGVFVTALEAAKRARVDKTSIVNRDHGPDWKFIMSLSINDMIELKDAHKYYRVQKLDGSNKRITLRSHHSSTLESNETELVVYPSSLQCKKISIDCLGYITPCND